jgi:hydroxypyruvate isomerase
VVIEALNSQENPRYPVTSSPAAIEVIDAVRAEGGVNVAFLADLYHLAMMGEDPSSVLTEHLDHIAHIQIADVPGRGAPGTGKLDFEAVFSQLAAQGYAGWVGCEFKSHNDIGTTPETFAWRQA